MGSRVLRMKEWAKEPSIIEFKGMTHPYKVLRESDGYNRNDVRLPEGDWLDDISPSLIRRKLRPLKDVVAEWKKMSKKERAEHQKKMMAKFKRRTR